MHPKKRKLLLSTGDFITNVGDSTPTFIGKIMSVSRRSYGTNIHVHIVMAPTRLGQSQMPDMWDYPYDMAINVFRKLTEAEKLLLTTE